MPKTLEDDLAITQKHEDFESVKKEIERLSKKIEMFGYLENSLNSMERISDSTVAANFYIGKRYTQLKVDYSNTPFTQNQVALIAKNTKEKTLAVINWTWGARYDFFISGIETNGIFRSYS
jgi:hypothetical protein